MRRYPKRADGFYPFIPIGTYLGFKPAPLFRNLRVFSARQFLLWKPERQIMTDDFRRLVLPLLTGLDLADNRHHYVHMVTREKPFSEFAKYLGKPDAECDPRIVMHMLQQQENERYWLYTHEDRKFFSDVHPNFVRVSPTVWIRITRVKRTGKPVMKSFDAWYLHAFDMADPATAERNKDKVLKPGTRLISGRSCA